VQENSDTTFRLYDWDHVDPKTGKPRDLQVDKALKSVNFDQGVVEPLTPTVTTTAPVRRERLIDNSHFRVERISGVAGFDVGVANEPRTLVCLAGAGELEHGGDRSTVERGAVFLIPASVGACRLTPAGPVTVLDISIPDPS
jgi:mannose-6-phosphate isomerase